MGKKKFTELVSGTGWIGGFIHLLVKEMRNQGWTDKEIYTLFTETDPDEEVAKSIVADLGRMIYPQGTDIFTLIRLDVVVDYRRTFDQMVRAGNYGHVLGSINGNKFPIRPLHSGLAEMDGSPYRQIAPIKTEVILVHLNQAVSTNTALGQMDRLGLEGSPIEEILAVGEKYPDLQRKFPIVGLGSIWQSEAGQPRYCPLLYVGANIRLLSIDRIDFKCFPRCRFLARRKRARPLLPPLAVVDDQ